MTSFDEREAAFEAKFAHDEHRQFVARMRRNRFMAIWASALKGDTVEQAREYARELISTDLQHISEDDVIFAVKKYLGDIADEKTIRIKMQEFLREAKEQLVTESQLS